MKDEAPDTPAQLKARALRYLVRREHSRVELARKLAAHAESAEALEAVLDSLAGKNQQSDARFAAERARVLSRKYGSARIRQDLKARGVAPELIDGGLPGTGDLERARAILERKYRLPAATAEERAKRARFLQGRGFSYDVIKRALGAPADD